MIFKRNFLNSGGSSDILQLIIISITHQILKIILQLLNLILFKFLITDLALTIISLISLMISIIIRYIISSLIKLPDNLTVLLRLTLYTRIILRWTTLDPRQFIDTLRRWTHFNLIISLF